MREKRWIITRQLAPIPKEAVLANGNALVPNDLLTTVLSHTNQETVYYLTEWSGTGQADGRYELWINGTKRMSLRSSAAQRNVVYQFKVGIPVQTNDVVEVKVYQDTEPLAKTFEGAIVGFR